MLYQLWGHGCRLGLRYWAISFAQGTRMNRRVMVVVELAEHTVLVVAHCIGHG